MARIVLFGATGRTGRLTAKALIERDLRPILVARDTTKLVALAKSLHGEPDLAIADFAEEESLGALLGRGDILLTTVGPFIRWGRTAANAAIKSGAHYMDSTGEPEFIRQMFGEWSDRGAKAGITLLPAFGLNSVSGNLAGAMALRAAGPTVAGLDMAYFLSGGCGRRQLGAGTLASFTASAEQEGGFAYRGGRLRSTRGADRLGAFELDGRKRLSLALGTSECFSLPRMHPRLTTVRCYFGLFGPITRSVRNGGTTNPEDGLPADEQVQIRVDIMAQAYDASGDNLSTIHLRGTNPYGLTAAILAWGCETTMAGRDLRRGTLGPLEAFGLEQIETACAEAGLNLHAEVS